MRKQSVSTVIVVAAVALTIGFGGLSAADEKAPAQAGEKIGVEGQFIRVAENNEGYVVLGYRMANESVNQEWMLLQVGMTLREGVAPQTITRDDLKVVTPDNAIISMATQDEFEKAGGELAALEKRAAMVGDSIDYFPPGANIPCRLKFFADPTHPRAGLAYDQLDLASSNACAGWLFFHIPGGIQYGNYNFDVHFADSILKVPMKIMTKSEAEDFEKKWKQELKESRHEGHKH